MWVCVFLYETHHQRRDGFSLDAAVCVFYFLLLHREEKDSKQKEKRESQVASSYTTSHGMCDNLTHACSRCLLHREEKGSEPMGRPAVRW